MLQFLKFKWGKSAELYSLHTKPGQVSGQIAEPCQLLRPHLCQARKTSRSRHARCPGGRHAGRRQQTIPCGPQIHQSGRGAHHGSSEVTSKKSLHLDTMSLLLLRIQLPYKRTRGPLRAHEGIFTAYEIPVTDPQHAVVIFLRQERNNLALQRTTHTTVRESIANQGLGRRGIGERNYPDALGARSPCIE